MEAPGPPALALDALMAHLPCGVMALSVDLEVGYVNATFLRTWSQAAGDWLGRRFTDVWKSSLVGQVLTDMVRQGEGQTTLVTTPRFAGARPGSSARLVIQTLPDGAGLVLQVEPADRVFADFGPLIEAFRAVLWYADPDGNLCYLLTDKTFLGYPVSHWLSDPSALTRPDSLTTVEPGPLAGLLPGLSDRQYTVPGADAQMAWLRAVTRPMSGGRQRVVGTLGITSDVTVRRTAELERAASQQRLQAIFDHARDGIILTDHDRRFVTANDAACRMLGHDLPSLLARRLEDVFPTGLVVGQDGETHLKRDDSVLYIEYVSVANIVPGLHMLMLHDVTVREQAEATVQSRERRFRSILENSSDLILVANEQGHLLYFSPSIERLFGYDAEALSHATLFTNVHPDDLERVRAIWHEVLAQSGSSHALSFRVHTVDGTVVILDAHLSNLMHDPDVAGIVVNGRDVTEHRRAETALRHSEEQFRHSQKMDAIGRLAGGVAHDFNNLLTVIVGYCQVLRADSSPRSPVQEVGLTEIGRAAEHAASLTGQLLAFSRRQVLQPRVHDLNKIITELSFMLARLIGEDIRLQTRLCSDRATLLCDRGQMEQVVMNLCINARDAMPSGGTIEVETRLEEGRILLSVQDEGEGMDAALRDRIFEPFFTTRPKGTGLGLSTVYGIIEETRGHIAVESTPGQGTTFTIRLPLTGEEPQADIFLEPPTAAGTETILLVEDDAGVRGLCKKSLSDHGYRVVEAPGGAEALEICAQFPGSIHLVVTDLVMPDMSGRQLVERLATLRPDMRALFVSGYTEDAVLRYGIQERGTHFLHKPFTPSALARKVRETLDQ